MPFNSDRPVLFLDVDGVLNAVMDSTRRRSPTAAGDERLDPSFRDWRRDRRRNFRITYSIEMGRRIGALGVDIFWLTTWLDHANSEIAPLFGWDPLPVLGFPEYLADTGPGWWKSAAAAAFVAEHQRPFIWIDDDLAWSLDRGDVEWLRTCEVPNLCISPHPGRGILPRHLDQIEAWIAERKAA